MLTRTEQIASKAMGAMKAAKATVKGLGGVFRKLSQEHGEVTALLMRVKKSTDVELRRHLFPDIRRELLAHEKAELQVVYPAFRRYAELIPIADAHQSEASQMEHVIQQLSATDYADAAWGRMFERLVDLVMHHATEEENQYFPKASRVMGDDEPNVLEKQYLDAKKSIVSSKLD
ncbi:MAG TPA: hemerythrin domain-containing protein [Polyangiaceae bacterium]